MALCRSSRRYTLWPSPLTGAWSQLVARHAFLVFGRLLMASGYVAAFEFLIRFDRPIRFLPPTVRQPHQTQQGWDGETISEHKKIVEELT